MGGEIDGQLLCRQGTQLKLNLGHSLVKLSLLETKVEFVCDAIGYQYAKAMLGPSLSKGFIRVLLGDHSAVEPVKAVVCGSPGKVVDDLFDFLPVPFHLLSALESCRYHLVLFDLVIEAVVNGSEKFVEELIVVGGKGFTED